MLHPQGAHDLRSTFPYYASHRPGQIRLNIPDITNDGVPSRAPILPTHVEPPRVPPKGYSYLNFYLWGYIKTQVYNNKFWNST